MQYIRIKPGTKAWGYFDLYWNQNKQWLAHRERIEALIGCPMDGNLMLSTYDLRLKEVPEHLKKSFSANPRYGSFWAKQNSKIRKEWLALVKELNLKCITSSEISMSLQTNARDIGYPVIKKYFPPMFGEYYVEAETSEEWKKREWADPVREENYLSVRMKWLQENPEEAPRDQENHGVDRRTDSEERTAEGT